jgi:hypothetical protein
MLCTHRNGPATFCRAVRWLNRLNCWNNHPDALGRTLPGQRAGGELFAVFGVAEAAACDPNDAGISSLQQVDAAQQRALSRPAGTEQCDDLAGPHGEIEVAEHDTVAVSFAQVAHFDRGQRAGECVESSCTL